jgi:hypothetical protein
MRFTSRTAEVSCSAALVKAFGSQRLRINSKLGGKILLPTTLPVAFACCGVQSAEPQADGNPQPLLPACSVRQQL